MQVKKGNEKRPLSMEPEFILNIGNEPCGFLQAFRVSKLPNLHAEPHALSLSPCLPNQFVPICV